MDFILFCTWSSLSVFTILSQRSTEPSRRLSRGVGRIAKREVGGRVLKFNS